MKYMVVECRLSYAVVLDEEGRFLKVANRNYLVGQTVTDIIEMQAPQPGLHRKKINIGAYCLAAIAACLLLAIASIFHLSQRNHASVYMSINPEVRIDVNRKDEVVGLEGINDDGESLIKDYSFKRKDLNLVMDELIDLAIDSGYLHEGGRISLALDADSEEWVVTHSDTLAANLNDYLREKMSVTIEITNKKDQNTQVIIPIDPGGSSYGESDYGEETSPSTQPAAASDPGGSNYEDQTDSDEPVQNNNVSDDDADDDNEPDNDGQSDYTSGGSQDDAQSDYGADDGDDEDDDPEDEGGHDD